MRGRYHAEPRHLTSMAAILPSTAVGATLVGSDVTRWSALNGLVEADIVNSMRTGVHLEKPQPFRDRRWRSSVRAWNFQCAQPSPPTGARDTGRRSHRDRDDGSLILDNRHSMLLARDSVSHFGQCLCWTIKARTSSRRRMRKPGRSSMPQRQRWRCRACAGAATGSGAIAASNGSPRARQKLTKAKAASGIDPKDQARWDALLAGVSFDRFHEKFRGN